MKALLTAFLLLPLIACAGKYPLKDSGMSAVEGKDFTALIEGCGNQMIAGYTYCRKTEGEAATDALYFFGPITNCKRDFCVEFKIYGPDGEVVYGNSLPKKSNRAKVSWKDLLKRETFEVGDRGFWLYRYRVFWLDENKNENVSISEGEIRLRVIAKGYTPLNAVISDSNFTWVYRTKNNELIKMTTGMRTYVSKK